MSQVGQGRALARAKALYRQGEFQAALEQLDAVLAQAPDLAVAQYLTGIILRDKGDARGAVAAFDRAIAVAPGLVRAHYHRGTARFDFGDTQGALEDFRVAAEREPGFLCAVYNLGVAAVALQSWEEARSAFARCLDLDPQNQGEYVDLLVDIGRSAAYEECYAKVHRVKNRIGLIGDRARRLRRELERGDATEAAVEANQVIADTENVFWDLVRFLRSVDQEPPEVDLIDMAELLDRCLFALSPKLRGLGVDRRVDAWLPAVIGDRNALGEALMNLLQNAVEAAVLAAPAGPAGGDVAPAIRVVMRAVDDIPEVPGVDSVEIDVDDTGPGFAVDVEARAFQLGFTTKHFGSGIGLTYAQRVVQAHGGRIELGRAAGGGGRVCVLLPASPVGAPNLRTLRLRSLLFEDLRPLTDRLPPRRPPGADG